MQAGNNNRYTSEQALVQACLDGCEDAWVVFQQLFTPLIYSILRSPKWRFSEQDAEDICAEVFMKLIDGGLRKFGFQCPLKNFVCIVTKNACIDKIRAQRARGTTVSLDQTTSWGMALGDMIDTNIRVAEIVLRKETLLEIKSVFEQLSEKCRRMLKLYYREELAYDQIAHTLGLSIGTVGSQISRCRQRLSDNMRLAFGSS